MKSKERYFIFIAVFAVVLLFVSAFAFADSTFYVNYADAPLPRFFDGVYAIGSGGAEMLMSDQVYALSSSGLELLGSAGANGGGGLLFDDGTVEIADDTIRVGLNYSYSESRDSSVESSELQNQSGGGFSIGYYDEDVGFVELAFTDSSDVTIHPEGGTSVGLYTPGQETPFYIKESTGRIDYLIVRPEPFDEEPLTLYGGNRYYGEFGYAVLADERLTVINIVDLEQYVMGVCASEMTESWPVEALKAQAVAARTYAQRNVHSSVYYFACGFDVTADTYSQAYRGARGVGDNIRQAVYATQNQYLTYQGMLIDAVYSAADGGATEDGQNVFGVANDYLLGVSDPYEAAADNENPYSEWKFALTPSQLGSKVGLDPIRSVEPSYSRTGNVIKLELVSVSGQTATLIRDRCRTALGLKNIRYEISEDSAGNFVFTGSGFGHNTGMSQWGAYAMAKYYEKDYRFILGFYYTQVGISYGTLA